MSIKPLASQSFYSNRGEKDEVAIFAKASYDIKKITLFGDLQVRMAKFSYKPSDGYGVSIEPVTWKFFNPKAGATYSFNSKNNLYVSIGKMHREPTRNDMFAGFDDMDTSNVALIGDLTRVKPESVTDFEIGTNVNLKNLKVQANLFRMDFKNEIAAIGQLSYIGLPLRKNVGSSYRQGIEIDYSWSPKKYISFSGTACYMKARIKEYTTDYDSITYTNVAPCITPEIVINQAVSFSFWKITTSISANYMGEAYLDNTMNDTLTMSANLLFNASASIKISNKCSVSIIANNLLDTLIYNSGYAMGGTRYYYVTAGRNLFATLNLKF
jgi:iron complex outermembrane receptor protein